jgi:uncharacterized protein YegL
VPELLETLDSDETQPVRRRDVAVEIRMRAEYASVPRKADPIVHVLADITPTGPPLFGVHTGPVAHVILLLDLSASMHHPDKYPVLTEALSGMLQELGSPRSAEVLVSVVVFAWGAETLLSAVPASRLAPRQLLAAIDASPLRFTRYTDAGGALRLAEKIAEEQLRRNAGLPTRIYVLSDGKPQDVPLATENVRRLRLQAVDLDSLAFGADADVRLLQTLVSGGRGGTVKLVRPDTLGDAFDRIADVAQRVVGSRAILEFETGRGVVARSVFRYRPGRHRFAGGSGAGSPFRTDLGALESGRTYSLLFELRVPESQADETELGRLKLRLERTHDEQEFSSRIAVARTGDAALPAADDEVVAARDVLAALTATDAETQLRALRLRFETYQKERRDPRVLAVIEKAVRLLETEGSLAGLSANESAALQAHTCTAGGARPPAARREFAAG